MTGDSGLNGIFSIGADRPFADTLAAVLLGRIESTPDALAQTIVFLPTRRAACNVVPPFDQAL